MGDWISNLPPVVNSILNFGGAIIGFIGAIIGGIFGWLKNRQLREAIKENINQQKEIEDRKREVDKQRRRIAEQRRIVDEQNVELHDLRKELKAKERELTNRERTLDRVRGALNDPDGRLWNIHDASDSLKYGDRIHACGRTIITVANLKGGVGKTTVVANLAAYLGREQNKRVLVIDLDYQGSLTYVLLSAIKHDPRAIQSGKNVNRLFLPDADISQLIDARISLDRAIPRAYLLGTYYDLATLENQLFVQYLFDEAGDDVRFRLARFLAGDMIWNDFDIVLIDVPPRLSVGTINALAASTHFLIPTVADQLSSVAVGTFAKQVKQLCNNVDGVGRQSGLNPHLKMIGIVPTMTHYKDGLTERETSALMETDSQVSAYWGQGRYRLERTIPRRAAFADALGEGLAIDSDNPDIKRWFRELWGEIEQRL